MLILVTSNTLDYCERIERSSAVCFALFILQGVSLPIRPQISKDIKETVLESHLTFSN